MPAKEPIQLRRGKAFHNLIQEEWLREAEGDVKPERHITKPSGRKGRVDIFVKNEDPKSPIAIVEIKATDWDRIKESNVRRNVLRQINQIWSYIESQIIQGKHVASGEGKDVCPGVIFPKRPKDKKRMNRIEEMFLEEGISVAWHDETIAECGERNRGGRKANKLL